MDFRILGPLEVVADGSPLPLGRRKQRAVLAILLVHANRVVSVDQLVEELWGDEPPARALGSLQAYVSHLRRLVEPGRPARTPAGVVQTRPPGYRLAVAPDDLDAARFEALVTRGRGLLEAGEPEAAAGVLADGLRLWRGTVLADFPDDPFAQVERGRLAELRLVAEEDRAAAELALGRHATVAAALDRLVAAHPFREGLHALRMLALYRAGRQGEALEAYQEAARALRGELGVDPGPELRRLQRRILEQAPELDAAPARPPVHRSPRVLDEPPADRLVGRDEQLAALDRAVAGHGRAVLLTGEPGIGKTRLAEEATRRARAGGVTVAWGRCTAEQGAPPFWPWVQILHGLLDDAPRERLDAVLGSDAPELAQLVPELAGAPPAVPVTDVEAVRFRVCHAVANVLRRLAAERPLLLVVDDLHAADAASLRLLSVLAGVLRVARLVIVMTCHEADDRLSPALAALTREATIDRIALGGLGPAEIARMIGTVAAAEPDEELARLVHRRTDGNPFYVVELLRLIGRRGPAEARTVAAQEIPAGVRDVLRRRLERLPEQANAVLLVGAAVGREFDLDTIVSVTGLDDEGALEAVEAALLSGLVVEDGERVGRFRFAHALIRDVIYDGVSRVRRARLHARVAAALDRSPAADPLDRAHQWWSAAPVVDADVVLPHLLAAADQAASRLAHEDAEEQLRRALSLLAGKAPSPERTRAELAVQLRLAALSAQLTGAASAATFDTVTRAAGLADELGDPSATITAYRSLYEVAVARAEHDAARTLADRMLATAERSGDPGLRAVAHLAVGRTLWCRGDPAAARDHLVRSLDLAAADDQAAHEPLPPSVTVRLQLAPVADLLGAREEATALLDAVLDETRTLAPLVRAGVLTSAALVSALGREVDRARAHATEALRLAGRLPVWSSYATVVREWSAAVGDAPADVALLRRSLDAIQAGGGQHMVAWGLGLLAEAETLAGRPDEGLRLLDDALGRVGRTGERLGEAELHRLRGVALRAAARPGAARAAFEEAVAVARRQGSALLERRASADLRALS